jgi:radical SAM protein with 4Fe4S-binding SPASM domain
MYVLPFWSYNAAEDMCVITNWLTRRSRVVPLSFIQWLENIYNEDRQRDLAARESALLIMARSLDILFDSRAEAEEWLGRREAESQRASPIIDQIELTNRCPYACKMCPRTVAMDRSLGNMRLDLFEQIIEQIRNRQQYVALHHFGESLVHPGLARAVEIAHTRGVETGLSCNPPSLHPKLGTQLLSAGISNLVLSLDSLDAATYREIRGNAAQFNRADSNLRDLVRNRDEGNYETFITLQMINMQCNETEADRFLQYCRELGVDRGVIIRLGRWDFDDEYLVTLGQFSSPGYNAYCTRPWESLVVLWDGRVVPCCHDYNGATVLGDLTVNSLDEIWHSAEVSHFREMNEKYDLCRQCAFSRWYREGQREQEGFRRFHQQRENLKNRKEWLNPNSLARFHGHHIYDDFDVLMD